MKRAARPAPGLLSAWLLLCAVMVLVMAVIGAITRLTESGLSITEWKPLSGALWPSNPAAWQREFDLYRASPQYRLAFAGMSLNQFQFIFFWEWFHRLFGRLIGLVYALPLFWFWLSGRIPKGFGRPLVGLLLLGGLQGFIGWFMVSSGLVGDMTRVSHIRLAMHLGLAFTLCALMIALAVRLRWPDGAEIRRKTYRHGIALLGFIALTIIWGAFVAGLRAGMIYNQFPLMGQGILPADFWLPEQGWRSFINSPAAVQFIHRWLAIFTALMAFAYGLLLKIRHSDKRLQRCGVAIMAMACLQPALGIATLLAFGHNPDGNGITAIFSLHDIFLGAAHQAGALILLSLVSASLALGVRKA